MDNPHHPNQIDDKNKKPRAVLVVSLITLLIAGSVVYYLFDPMESRWMPQCLFRRLTGLQCMGCGSQRMFHALLHGDVAGAFRANAFGLMMLPLIAFMFWAEMRRTRYPQLYKRVFSPWLIYTLIGLMIVWIVVRNIIGI